MAKNIIMGGLNQPVGNLAMAVTAPASNTTTLVPASGAPVLVGRIPGVAETTIDPVTALTVVNHTCIAELAVVGTNNAGNSAVSVGDLIYISTTGVLSKDSVTGGQVVFGTAFAKAQGSNSINPTRTGQLVAAGATTTIQVWVGKVN